jgi:hypothetical protein
MMLKTLAADPPSGRQRPLFIDDAQYSTAVIRQGAPIPWTDTAALTAHFGQVRGLLDPDAQWIDIRQVFEAHCGARPELIEAMGARSRCGYPLRTVLGDPRLLTAVLESLGTVAATSARPLVLHVPSPAFWLDWAHRLAGNPLDDVDADRADGASMYIAEWLGQLGALPLALVLFDARPARFSSPEHLESYTALANVAAHFDWSLALWQSSEIVGQPGSPSVGVIAPEFWISGDTVPDTDVLVTTIPDTGTPETVLDQLATLR